MLRRARVCATPPTTTRDSPRRMPSSRVTNNTPPAVALFTAWKYLSHGIQRNILVPYRHRQCCERWGTSSQPWCSQLSRTVLVTTPSSQHLLRAVVLPLTAAIRMSSRCFDPAVRVLWLAGCNRCAAHPRRTLASDTLFRVTSPTTQANFYTCYSDCCWSCRACGFSAACARTDLHTCL
jgi:hypothetical protein